MHHTATLVISHPSTHRQVPEIRNDPMHAHWGGMVDILEHEYWCDREREAVWGSYKLDGNADNKSIPDLMRTMAEQGDADMAKDEDIDSAMESE